MVFAALCKFSTNAELLVSLLMAVCILNITFVYIFASADTDCITLFRATMPNAQYDSLGATDM